jgi:sulfite dehydrogenase (quinone) subunit SoeC
MIFFTTLVGAAQGLMLALVGIDLAATIGVIATVPHAYFQLAGAGVVLLLCVVGLAAATFHLGHPLRAWRAAAMWRTSWLSRELIVLPAFMACVAGWGWSHAEGYITIGWGLSCVALALLLYVCTGMIYAAVRAIPQWATAMTPINFTLIGLASGLLLCTALAALLEPALMQGAVLATLIVLSVAAVARALTMHRNLTLVPKTTTQSAIGVRHPRIVQTSQGMSAGSFGTREFFHGTTPGMLWAVRIGAALLGAVVPLAVLAVEGAALPALTAVVLCVVQMLGLWAERWSFFAEGQHPQNLYHQSR